MLLDTCSTIFFESNHFHVPHVRITETLGRMMSPSSYDQLAVTDHPSNERLRIWIKREFGGIGEATAADRFVGLVSQRERTDGK